MDVKGVYAVTDTKLSRHMLVYIGNEKYVDITVGGVYHITMDDAYAACRVNGRYGRPVLEFVKLLPDDVYSVVEANASTMPTHEITLVTSGYDSENRVRQLDNTRRSILKRIKE